MTASTPPDASVDAIVRVSHPDPAKRLHLPPAASVRPKAPAKHKAQHRPDRRDRVKPLKKIERYIAALFKLGRTEWMAKQSQRKLPEIENQVADIRKITSDHARDIDKTWVSIDALVDRQDVQFDRQMEQYKAGISVMSRSISDLTQRLDRLMMREAGPTSTTQPAQDSPVLPSSEGFTAFKDQFYNRLENRYRGSRSEIARRLRIYLPDVEAAVMRTDKKPVMDLGCGRGEWLELLSEMNIEAFGVDTNPVQIAEGQELGLDLRLGDALKMLAKAETGSLSVISAHHLIEHLPFDMVAWITREALRVLAPGGILLFETPDTRNVLVGATTFHTDPTHLKPMPEQVMGVLFETAGFHPVDIRHLNAHERFEEFMAKPGLDDEIAFLMFGPQDLCVLGTKPLTES
jgi:SAM-dependent methyltransferase